MRSLAQTLNDVSTSEEAFRAFLTHSARARGALAPMLEQAEALLQSLNWRTRIPMRPAPSSVSLEERRRLREQSYREVERSQLVLHFPSPSHLSGTQLNRELNHAVRHGKPILVLLCSDLRRELDIGLPDPTRLDQLLSTTRGRLVDGLEELHGLLTDWPGYLTER